MSHALILLAHGSRDPRWRSPFEQLTATLAARSATPLRLAFMELSEPSLASTATELESLGVTQADVLPLFFAAGRHLREDVPAQLEALRRTNPHIRLDLLAPVGDHPAFVDALASIIEAQATANQDECAP